MVRTQHAAARCRGLTLIELLVVLVIVAVLAGMAWPSFEAAIRKSRRSDASTAIAALMQAQERHRANNTRFASELSEMTPQPAASSAAGYYTLSIVGNSTAVQYVLRATATGTQAGDSPCEIMSVTMNRGQIVYGSANAAGVPNTTDTCWPR